MTKYVYLFNEGNKDMRNLLGGKGANLAEMTKMGLPVPSGFTITTEACNRYYQEKETISDDIVNEIMGNILKLEELTHKKLGDKENPLLVSVRSGARASMPGMMDSIHFIGMNDEVADTLIKKTNNPRFVYDTYRRFLQTFTDIAINFPDIKFEKLFEELKNELHVENDADLSVDQLKFIIERYKSEYKKRKRTDFPTSFKEQLLLAVRGVFASWNGQRAKVYRRINNIPDDWGTAVNVQENVFGNMNDASGTGVAFSRNPATGENEIFGEYLINAQGDDVVAGIRTPQPISTLKEIMPNIYNEFASIAKLLEKHYRDMQDMEFTIENGKLYMLQTRNAKRTAQAAVKVAVDMVNEKLISKKEAILMVDPKQLDALLHPTFNQDELKNSKVIGEGLAASPGAGAGKIYFNAEDVKAAYERKEKAILIREETSPEDIEGMHYSQGVLTIHGGMTSHAAVVARGMGICCVSGASNLRIDESKKVLYTNDHEYKEGDEISIDGTTGKVYEGLISLEEPNISGDFKTFMDWVDEEKHLKVRANADTFKDATVAKRLGAEGIGLCRTEHMFFEKERIFNFRKMICATTIEERQKALLAILPYQRADFENLFKVMAPYPVVIRYLDPPLHEFLPKTDAELLELAKATNKTVDELKEIIADLKEFNPMMGHRGCRLAITYPEIAIMQTRAVIEAAINSIKKGLDVKLEIMIPLVGDVRELAYVKSIVNATADFLIGKANVDLKYEVGTMIEVPRATVIADKIAKYADFFSFGTNDLTQLTYGFSRDDANKFLKYYYDKNIFTSDPFAHIDQEGVGKLVATGVNKARMIKPNLSIGICGEHGGDPESIEFFDKTGFDYVSCSPYRVPIARLAAAQAAIKSRNI